MSSALFTQVAEHLTDTKHFTHTSLYISTVLYQHSWLCVSLCRLYVALALEETM